VSFGSVLRRGVLAGVCAGLASAAVIWLVVEPVIRRALAIEEARGEHAHGGGQSALGLPASLLAHGDEPLVSRTAQVVVGGITAILVGVAVGVVFSVVFARMRSRLPGRGDLGRALVLAAVGFAAVSLLPALKMPANPPAVGDPATVTRRTMLYGIVLLLGIAIALATNSFDRWLTGRVSGSTRCALDIGAVVVGLVLVFVLVPGTPDVIPSDVPAGLIWDFRLASLAQLGSMWLALGVSFGLLMERGERRRTEGLPDREPVAA
jgi:predicted cobalt transporter CbtA